MHKRDPDELTDREREVLALLRRDFTNEQIAQRLGISPDGAKYHVSQILSKLGVATREEAAGWRPKSQHAGYWKWALIGGAATLMVTASIAIALVIRSDGQDVPLESQVFARYPKTESNEPGRAVASSTPRVSEPASRPSTQPEVSALPSQATGPQHAVGDLQQVTGARAEFPTEPEGATPLPTDAPVPSVEASATPVPTSWCCSGIEGRAVESPTCPAEPVPPIPECAPRPVQATIAILNPDRTQEISQFTTDSQGNFRVPLPPGKYYVEPRKGGFQAPPPFAIDVPHDQFIQLEIHYSSGIQ